MRMMGLDVGDKRIGVALCDPLEIISSAITTIERDEDGTEFEEIVSMVRERGVERIVVGLPRLLDGGLGTQAEKTQVFVDELVQLTPVPVEMCDERLSTNVAEQKLHDAGRSHKEIRQKKDAAAAAVILQWYLDEKAMSGNNMMENEAQWH